MWNNDVRNDFDFNFSTSDGETVSLNFKAVSIEHILAKFEDFLHGCGYKLDGTIKIMPNASTPAQPKYTGSFNSYPTSGGITKEQIAALTPVGLQPIDLSSASLNTFTTTNLSALKPEDLIYNKKNEDILHFGV